MKERWILTGKYMNGDSYVETFDSFPEMLDVMYMIYTHSIDSNTPNFMENDEIVNVKTLQIEDDG